MKGSPYTRAILVAPLLLVAAAGCSGKKPGAAVRPKEMTASEALGQPGPGGDVKCAASDDDKTLIVDLEATDRKAIEEMVNVKKMVPVVGYDCKTLKILPSCKLEADFDYVGSSSREQVIEIENFDKVSASIPLASASLKASVQAGRKMAIALVEVGSRSSSMELVARPQLKGVRGSDCDGATHFIYKVDVGAFAIAQTTSGEAAAAAELFGAGAGGESKDSRSSSKKEGAIDACKKSSGEDRGSPGDCSVPLRVYLRRIYATAEEKEKAQQKAEKEEESVYVRHFDPPCPNDLVRAEGGTCVAPSPGIRYLCRDDIDECKAQCTKGHAGSCARLGRAYLMGSLGRTKVERDPDQAVASLETACLKSKGSRPEGCSLLPDALSAWVKNNHADKADAARSRAEGALRSGCDRADEASCAAWGRLYESGNSTLKVNPDVEHGIRYYVRACNLGDQYSCVRAGTLYVEGSRKGNTETFKPMPAEGLKVLDGACRQGAVSACNQLSVYLTSDKYKATRDTKRAAALFNDLCAKNNKSACAEYALLQINGEAGVKADPAVARKTIEDLCYDERVAPACYGVALLAETGKGGVTKNEVKAAEFYAKASYVKDASLRLGRIYDTGSKAVPADPARAAGYYKTACNQSSQTDPNVCKKAGDLALKLEGSNTFGAGRLFQRACEIAPYDTPVCDKAQDLMRPKGGPGAPPGGAKPPAAGKKK